MFLINVCIILSLLRFIIKSIIHNSCITILLLPSGLIVSANLNNFPCVSPRTERSATVPYSGSRPHCNAACISFTSGTIGDRPVRAIPVTPRFRLVAYALNKGSEPQVPYRQVATCLYGCINAKNPIAFATGFFTTSGIIIWSSLTTD
jgi:hypothetical protein